MHTYETYTTAYPILLHIHIRDPYTVHCYTAYTHIRPILLHTHIWDTYMVRQWWLGEGQGT